MILPPGIHADIDPTLYHLDQLTPEPALSSSGIKKLLSGSPAEFAASNPRLSQWPDWAMKAATKPQDLGSIVHAIVLGKGCDWQAIDPQELAELYGIRLKSGPRKGQPYTTWTGAAKEWKEEKEAPGIIIVNREDGARVQAAADSMIALLRSEYGDWPIGHSEQVVIWQRETSHGPIWCRAMVDHLAFRFMTVLDLKSTDWPISDHSIQKLASAGRWHIQVAWYLQGVTAAKMMAASSDRQLAHGLDRLTLRLPVVQINPPYQARFWDPSPYWLEIAESDIDIACDRFGQSIHSGKFAPYPRVCTTEPPTWMANEYENRRLAILEGRLEHA